jgi:hypothetical protein
MGTDTDAAAGGEAARDPADDARQQAQADSIGQRGIGQEVGPLHLQCLR